MSPKDAPDFNVDLARGHAGERYLMAQHPVSLRLAPPGVREYDLLLEDGRPNAIHKVEVKCDSYALDKTPNFFFERHTRVHGDESAKGTLLGGPWRAADHGVDVFVYLFHKPGREGPSVAYWFYDVPTLVATLTERLNDYEVRQVRSARLTAVGVLVPRESLSDLYSKVEYGKAGDDWLRHADAAAAALEWVTEERLRHVRAHLPASAGLPDVISAMQAKVLREGAGELADNPAIRRAIGTRTAQLFKRVGP